MIVSYYGGFQVKAFGFLAFGFLGVPNQDRCTNTVKIVLFYSDETLDMFD